MVENPFKHVSEYIGPIRIKHDHFSGSTPRMAQEKMPDLWQELHEELLLAVWLGSDAALQARLAEGAAGSPTN